MGKGLKIRCLCFSMTLQENMSKYLFWADSTIWKIVEGLTDEEFNQDFYDNGGSIQRRYIHLAQDLWEWYYDWIGQEQESEPDFTNMSREELFSSVRKYSKLFTNMVQDRSINHIELDTENTNLRITFDEILFHLVNHATYHRGQIVMGLRILGKDVVMTDYVPHRIQQAEGK